MILNCLAYFIIPVYTLLFAGRTDWLHENFSIIRNFGFRKWAFVVWGMLLVFYFYLSMKEIVRFLPRRSVQGFLCRASLCLLVLTILTPYKPEDFPVFSSLHVWFAFTCPVLLMTSLLAIILQLRKRDLTVYRRFFTGFWCIAAACAVFYFSAGMINSLLEVFFVLSCTLLVKKLHRRVADLYN